MSGGVVEFRLASGAAAVFRADAVSVIAEPEVGESKVRVFVGDNPVPYALAPDLSWMEAVRQWRRELTGGKER